MLELMVEFRVWAECRPTHENEVHSAKLIGDLDAIEERELNQGSFNSRCWHRAAVALSARLSSLLSNATRRLSKNSDVISLA